MNDFAPSLVKKHKLRFGLYMAAYVVSILVMAGLKEDYGSEPVFYVLVALPCLFTFLALRESYLSVMSLDELERRIHLEGVFISASVVGGLTFVWGLFTHVGVPQLDPTFILPMLIGGWGIAVCFRKRAYHGGE